MFKNRDNIAVTHGQHGVQLRLENKLTEVVNVLILCSLA
jgi:hypothetical protein